MDLLTVDQVAKELGVSSPRVYQLITEGRLPATKFGKAWAIKKSDVKRYRPGNPGRPPTYVVYHGKRSWDITAQGPAKARDKVIELLGESAPPASEFKVTRRRKPSKKGGKK